MQLVFIMPGPLLPIRNGQQSTGLNLIEKLSPHVELTVVLIYLPGRSQAESANETTEHLNRKGIKFKTFELSSGSKRSFWMIFLPPILRNWVIERQLRVPDGMHEIYNCSRDCILYFGGSLSLFAHWHALQARGCNFFFPADSIGYFQRNNLDAGVMRRLLRPFKRWFAEKVEGSLFRSKLKRVFYVSAQDQNYVRKQRIDRKNISRVVPIGVNLPPLAKTWLEAPAQIKLIFSGVLTYRPNEEAAFFLVNQIMPYLPKDQFILYLVGMDPSPALRSHASQQIVITGEVPDINEYLLKCDIFVSPLFSGAGAKNKILAALGCGLPVLGTTQSFSGFNLKPPGAILCNSQLEFISQLLDLPKVPAAVWREQGYRAREYIKENSTWEASVCSLLNWIREGMIFRT